VKALSTPPSRTSPPRATRTSLLGARRLLPNDVRINEESLRSEPPRSSAQISSVARGSVRPAQSSTKNLGLGDAKAPATSAGAFLCDCVGWVLIGHWPVSLKIVSHCFSSTRRDAESCASVRSASVASTPLSFSSAMISFCLAIRRPPLATWSRIKCAVLSTVPLYHGWPLIGSATIKLPHLPRASALLARPPRPRRTECSTKSSWLQKVAGRKDAAAGCRDNDGTTLD
jgi:hypothetical protein